MVKILSDSLRRSLSRSWTRLRNPALVGMESVVDENFYFIANPDLSKSIRDPVRHFAEFGAMEGRLASPWFSPQYVYSQNTQISWHDRPVQSVYATSGMAQRPRMIFVSHEATRTGAPAILLRLIEMFGASGDVECFSLLDTGGERVQDFVDISHTYKMSRTRYTPGFTLELAADEIGRLFAPEGIFCSNRPVCALVNSMESQRYSQILTALGVPVISLLHEFADYYSDAALAQVFEASRRVIFPSQIIQSVAFQNPDIDKSKGLVRGQGLLKDGFGQLDHAICREHLRAMLGLAPDALIVLNVGSKDVRKGVDYFVEAARQFMLDHPDDRQVHFVWFGGNAHRVDPAFTAAAAMARTEALAGRVHFMPSTSEIETVFCGADIFFLSARADPFPCVIHEAMACGLPVIAFRNGGGAPELIGDDAGTVVEMADFKAVADAIARYRAEPALRSAHAETAAKRIREDWTYQSYFNDVLAEVRRVSGKPGLMARSTSRPVSAHQVIMAGLRSDLEYLDRLRAMDGPPIDDIVLFAGHFSPETAEVMAQLKSRGLNARLAQPLHNTAPEKAVLIRSLLSHSQAQKLTLIADPALLEPQNLATLAHKLRVIVTIPTAVGVLGAQDSALHLVRLAASVGELFVGSEAIKSAIVKVAPSLTSPIVVL